MNILTFDIEDWFHLLDEETTKSEKEWVNYKSRIEVSMNTIFDLLDSRNQSATFFCLGWVAKEYPEIVREIDRRGFEVGSHSYAHQLIYEQTPDQFRADLDHSIKTLEDVVGKKIVSYRAPGFSLKEGHEWVFEMLLEYGIEIDCSIFPAGRSHGGYPSFGAAEPALLKIGDQQLKEFPMNVARFAGRNFVFSGGGYFRVFPYAYIDRLTRKASYVMTYFHPRDFDPDQPMIENLSSIRRFKSYYGLSRTRSKLERLITEHSFMDLQEADQSVDWSSVRTVDIA